MEQIGLCENGPIGNIFNMGYLTAEGNRNVKTRKWSKLILFTFLFRGKSMLSC